jgi:hypothetical protein
VRINISTSLQSHQFGNLSNKERGLASTHTDSPLD